MTFDVVPPQVAAVVERVRRPGPLARRAILTIATVAFLIIVVWGLTGYRSSGLEANVMLLVVTAAVGTPLALALNAVELHVMSRAAGAELTPRESLVATTFASAANSLPVPGSVLVRGWSLADKGASLATVARVQAVAGLTFVAVALALTGPLVATANAPLGIGIGLIGVVATTALLVWGPRAVRQLIVVEAAMVGSELARFSLVLAALGVGVTPARASGLVVANVLAVAIGVFPAGLGMREALAALIATVTSLDPSVAVTISVTDRVATSVVLACFVGVALGIGFRPTSARGGRSKRVRPGRTVGVGPDTT